MKYVLMIAGALLLGYVGVVNTMLYCEWEAGPLAHILGFSSGVEIADPVRFAKEQISCLLLGLAVGGAGYRSWLRSLH